MKKLAEFLLAVAHQHRLDDADANKQRGEGTAAVAYKGEGKTSNRNQPHVHADIYGRLKEDYGGNAHTNKLACGIRRQWSPLAKCAKG